VSEIAAEIGVSPEELVCSLEAVQTPASLSDPIYRDETSALKLEDRLGEGNSNDWLEHILLRQLLQN